MGGQIPGSLFWNVYTDLLEPNYRIIEREAFVALLGKSGVRPRMRVVYVYAASLPSWMMVHHGHHQVSFLNGSRTRWIADGRPLSIDDAVPMWCRTCIACAVTFAPRTASWRNCLAIPEQRFMNVRSVAE